MRRTKPSMMHRKPTYATPKATTKKHSTRKRVDSRSGESTARFGKGQVPIRRK